MTCHDYIVGTSIPPPKSTHYPRSPHTVIRCSLSPSASTTPTFRENGSREVAIHLPHIRIVGILQISLTPSSKQLIPLPPKLCIQLPINRRSLRLWYLRYVKAVNFSNQWLDPQGDTSILTFLLLKFQKIQVSYSHSLTPSVLKWVTRTVLPVPR